MVLVGAPAYAKWMSETGGASLNQSELRGLNLPRGSLRSILALMTISSFVNVMVPGAPFLGD